VVVIDEVVVLLGNDNVVDNVVLLPEEELSVEELVEVIELLNVLVLFTGEEVVEETKLLVDVDKLEDDERLLDITLVSS
jgi:hypothetical protein